MTWAAWIAVGAAGLIAGSLLIAHIQLKLTRIDMTLIEFGRRLIFGSGFTSISPQQLHDLRALQPGKLVVIDLSVKPASLEQQIPDSSALHMDDFLRQVVVDHDYQPADPIALVCDTGHISTVAADILVQDLDFSQVYNLKGGMAAWRRWEAARTNQACCWLRGWLAQCCTPRAV